MSISIVYRADGHRGVRGGPNGDANPLAGAGYEEDPDPEEPVPEDPEEPEDPADPLDFAPLSEAAVDVDSLVPLLVEEPPVFELSVDDFLA